MRIVIVGCGIGGAALARACTRLGIDWVMLEQAPRLTAVGAGVQLSPNGMRVLAHLGADAALAGRAFEPQDMRYRDWRTGETLLSTPLAAEVVKHFGAPYLHAHRADLLEALTDGLDRGLDSARVRLGVRVTRVEQRDGRAIAHLDDGSREEGDVLVGADGIHSVVRQQVFRADAPQSSGCIAYRGLVDADAAASLGITSSGHFWMGPGYSMVVYYVSGGRQINWIGIGSSPDARRESWSATTTVDEVLDVYRGWNGEVTSLIAMTAKPFVTAIYDRAPLEHWVDGRIVLLGDAAHAMLPYHAQGAVQSMEDAWVLARLLASATRSAASVDAALSTYESLRTDRTVRIQAQSRVAEHRFHMADPAEVARRNARMRAYDATFTGAYLPQQQWLFAYDADLAATGRDDAWRALRPWDRDVQPRRAA